MTWFLGIDPGIDGAVAAVPSTGGGGPRIWDTPTHEVVDKKKVRRVYQISVMSDILAQFTQEPAMAVLEQAAAMPGQSSVSTMKQGYGIGVWETLLVVHKIPYTLVWPAAWKKVMLEGMPKDGKGTSIVRATQLFPVLALPRKKDHNRADALLLAEWLRRQHAQ